jgi:hypothetical protein
MRGGLGVWQDFVGLFYDVGPIFSRVLADSALRASALRVSEGDVYNETASRTVAQLKESFGSIRMDTGNPLNVLLQLAEVG